MRISVLALATASCSCLLAGGSSGADGLDFNRDVKPILSENCYFCHGPDAKERKADLRLDSFEGATAGVIVPGQPAESELIARIFSDDPDERMPPPEAKISLRAEEKELLERWVASGAEYAEHWSLVPPEKAALSGDGHPLDELVANALRGRGMGLAPEASREILIRRVSLDLTGLPPTPEEVAIFVSDEQPGAYERLVDRLLASPAYGERMAWDWLDAARYADSNGYQGDNERTMWPWRDWVVKAFNMNMPYDQFTIWQLAGDLVPDGGEEAKLATGFCRNHPINGEGGRIAEENRVDYVMDMTETMGTVWLGLTLNCCRCHDHKFDPLEQRDYYRFTDFFNQTPVDGGGGDPQTAPVIQVLDSQVNQEIAALGRRIGGVEEKIALRERELRQQRAAAPGWTTLVPVRAEAEIQDLTVEPSGEILASGENPKNDTYTIELVPELDQIAGLRIDALKHASMTGGGLARSGSSNFVLTEIELTLLRAGSGEGERIAISSSEATFEQGALHVAASHDGDPNTGWAVYEGRTVDREHAAVWKFETPLPLAEGDRIIAVLRHDSQHAQHHLGYFRLSATSEPGTGLVPAEDAGLEKLEAERDGLVERRDTIAKGAPKVMVMQDMEQRRKTFILDSGLYSKPGDEVSPGVPASLPPMPDGAPENRLGLARWLVAAENPLTARVTVNRFWQQLFGVGLVKTSEDFGSQGELPPQQPLLDWLAVDFRESGWDVKRLMKMIVTSRAYRQSAKSADGYVEDPENRWLARGPRFRMPSWMLRDQALAASGLLVQKLGGAPLNPYQPAGIWEETSYGKKQYHQSSGDDLYRRSLYTFWRRIAPPTAFFDNAGRQVCQVRPLRTNTPLHALYTLNDVTFVEAARALAQKAIIAHPDDAGARMNFVYFRILARPPQPEEQGTFTEILGRTRAQFAAAPPEAEAFLSAGDSPRDPTLDLAEHASWTALCLAVLNLDEAVTKP